MSEEITVYSKEQSSLENFQKLLNSYPTKQDVKVNKMANNSRYLPINYIERKLDTEFSGLWQIENFRWEVVANEIIGSMDLKVFHPIAKTWLVRTGCAATMILTASGKPATVENKIKNTLVKDFPHLKAECLKNAAKSLGVAFGRNLNRGEDDEYQYLSESLPELNNLQEQAMSLLDSSTVDDQDREKIYNKIPRSNNKTLNEIVNYLKNKQ
jgi:hypothetical protein